MRPPRRSKSCVGSAKEFGLFGSRFAAERLVALRETAEALDLLGVEPGIVNPLGLAEVARRAVDFARPRP